MNVSFSASKGRPIVAADNAMSVGRVDDLIVDSSATQVAAIGVDGHGRRSHVVRWSAITAFGGDAVMTRLASDIVLTSSDEERRAAAGERAVIGKRVLTTAGADVGSVTDVTFDASSGVVASIITDHATLEGRNIRSVGSYALIVDAETPQPIVSTAT